MMKVLINQQDFYQHRGIDVEVKIHGVSGGKGVSTEEFTGGVGKIATKNIQDVISKITLKLEESIKLKNVTPKGQQ